MLVCLFGCSEAHFIDLLYAPEAEQWGVVGAVPPEIQEILWSGSDELLRAAQEAHYTRYIDAGGIAIIGSRFVDDEIFRMARDIVLEMTSKRPELREALSPQMGHYQILINGRFEELQNIPEYADIEGKEPTPGRCVLPLYCYSMYWDHPYSPGNSRETRFTGILEVFVHEFAHAIHVAIGVHRGLGKKPLDPGFDDRLLQAYENAVALGIWSGEYTETNYQEYWAEGVQAWYYLVTDSPHPIRKDQAFETYAAFAERDPLLVALLQEWFHETSFWGRY